jgi:hypothetical protein
MTWSAFYKDIMVMTKNALDKDSVVLPEYVFKYKKRKCCLEFLQRIMAITGLCMDHLFIKTLTCDQKPVNTK